MNMILIYEFLTNQLDEGIHVVDATGKTIVYNRKMAAMESMAEEDVLDKDMLDVFTFPEEGYSTLLHAVRTGASISNVKQTYFNKKGEAITTVNNTMPIVIAGEICGAVEIARDITKISRIQEHFLKRNETQFTFERIIGDSPATIEVISQARRAARTTSSILLIGETGTGKELFAQSIHQASPRCGRAFVSQNCAALPEALIEGSLFGTVPGAFPGAIDRPGLLEQADGGTLLLDEINATSLTLQAKLLRAIQERVVRRLGDTADRPVDVRILATMNEDPLDAIAEARLRKDLYYRLSVVTLFLPPLRERREDIAELTTHFIQKYNTLFGMHIPGPTQAVTAYFMNYAWPGNVRELAHTIEGAMNIAADDSELDVLHLPLYMRRQASVIDEKSETRGGQLTDYANALEEKKLKWQLGGYERAYIQKVLAKHQGNVSASARELGLSRQSLQYRLRKWRESQP